MKSIYILLICLFVSIDICNAQGFIELYTPRGSVVYGAYREEFTSAEIASYTEEARTMYPEATILAPSSRKYNCHSYAWNLTTGGTINC